ncbi:MAG: phosphoribosylformylglycinamidine synthase I [Anaerolineae bacterium]|nr:phosphoribosylformylglycinamidine synthase I [Anaerolineae bacterium]
MRQPKVLILHATGTNRDVETAAAVELAGGAPTIVHVNALRESPARLHAYQMFILPGGFSYGDALGAGRLWASDLRWLFQDEMARFVEAGKPVLGVCNGFQALVKSGWLPGPPDAEPKATLTRNASNQFECRWVWLEPNPKSHCVFTKELTERITCPVAHGEGRFVPRDDAALETLRANRQIALTYVAGDEGPADYPANPNGSVADIAGICNERGNVMGLMPHPEDHVFPEQHPRYARGEGGELGLALYVQGVKYAAQL